MTTIKQSHVVLKKNSDDTKSFLKLKKANNVYDVEWVDTIEEATQFNSLVLIQSHLYFMKLQADKKPLIRQNSYNNLTPFEMEQISIVEVQMTYPDLAQI